MQRYKTCSFSRHYPQNLQLFPPIDCTFSQQLLANWLILGAPRLQLFVHCTPLFLLPEEMPRMGHVRPGLAPTRCQAVC